MRKMNKKAFTIVELVIVIAVIAVLAAVLVPTFIGIIRRSRVSTDTQLVRNLNIALAEDSVNNEHNTMTDVLAVAEDYGYVVANLNAKAKDNEILWDSANDVFCYLNEGKVEYLPDSVKESKKLEAGDYRLWKIYNKAPADGEGYSIYVASQAAADYVASNEVAVGVDCGEYFIDTISYKNTGAAKKDVVIRTNSGTLTIDAEKDTVNHYGNGLVLDIKAIADSSYHEYGYFPYADLKAGRIVVENGGKIETISTLDASETVYVDAVSNLSTGTILSSGSNLATNNIATETVVTTAKITTVNDLKNAVTNNSKVIVLGSDIDLINDQILLDHSVEIIGEGHTLTSTHKRFIQITTSDVEVKLSYLNLISVGAEYDTRAIAINSAASNVNLVINNVNIDSYNNFNAVQNKHNGAIVTLGNNHKINVFNSKIVMHLTADETGYEVLATAKYAIKISSSNTVLNMENTIIDAPQCVCLVNNTGSTVNAKKSTFIGRNNYNSEPADGVLFEQGSFIAPAVFENCDFVSAVEGDSDYCPIAAGTALGSNEGAYVIIRNCRVDGVKFTADNIYISTGANLTYDIQ